jgi:hypothetical protein
MPRTGSDRQVGDRSDGSDRQAACPRQLTCPPPACHCLPCPPKLRPTSPQQSTTQLNQPVTLVTQHMRKHKGQWNALKPTLYRVRCTNCDTTYRDTTYRDTEESKVFVVRENSCYRTCTLSPSLPFPLPPLSFLISQRAKDGLIGFIQGYM